MCGSNVRNMRFAYQNCYNLTGSPVCGDKVTDMGLAYYSCSNLTGYPVCGNNVIYMYAAYRNCYNLIGSPVCGPNVTEMYFTYANCTNLHGNMFVLSDYVSNVNNCFTGRNNALRLNIYVNINSKSYNTFKTNYSYITGGSTSYLNTGSYLYNTRDNIYIYPVNNVQKEYELSILQNVNIPELIDFNVVYNNNMYELLDWKQTTNGVSGTEVIIPYIPNINIIY